MIGNLRTVEGPGIILTLSNLFSLVGVLLVAGCGLAPSNPVTPPEILVAGQSGTSGAGSGSPYSLPFSGTPSPLATVSIPAGLSLRGGTVADNTLIYLAKDASDAGSFLVSGIPLSSSSTFRQIKVVTGMPVAMAQITGQVLVVLATSSSTPQGCLEFFNTGSLISLPSGGSIASSCIPFSGTGTLVNGFLLPFSDGVGFMVGRVFQSGTSYTTEITITSQNALTPLLGGGTMPSPLSTWTLSTSYQSTAPISGAALSSNTVILLPDPSSNAIDLYKVTTLYGSGGGTLDPSFPPTPLALSAPPLLLSIDPANNFMLAGSGGEVSIFGLDSVLSPPGTLGPLGEIRANTGMSFGALVTYAGSS